MRGGSHLLPHVPIQAGGIGIILAFSKTYIENRRTMLICLRQLPAIIGMLIKVDALVP